MEEIMQMKKELEYLKTILSLMKDTKELKRDNKYEDKRKRRSGVSVASTMCRER